MDRLQTLVLTAYDRLIGLALGDVAVDGCITTAPCGGELAGRSPVDRGKAGLKCPGAVDTHGIPLGTVVAPANRHDSPLLASTLDALDPLDLPAESTTVHLDRGYDSGVSRQRLSGRGLAAESVPRDAPAPVTAGRRRVVERTHA